MLSHIPASPAAGQEQRRITGDRLSGFVLPIEPVAGDITITALRANAWNVDDTRRLLVRGDVRISIAGRSFTGDSAAVWINRIPSSDGLINQIAVYFDRVDDAAKPSGTGVAGENLLITGSTRGEVLLDSALLVKQRPDRSGLLDRGEARLAAHLQKIAAQPPRLGRWTRVDRPEERDSFTPIPGGRFDPETVELPETTQVPERPDPTPWLGGEAATLHYAAEQIDIDTGEEENIITLVGPLVVDYVFDSATADGFERLTLSAQRGVIFTDPAPLEDMAGGALDGDAIRGIYLEGSVIVRANEDEYVLRSPRVYYDFRSAQAIMVDAVLRTYSREHDMLVYSRAQEMRQIAENQWTAKRVRVSTSEFFTPHVAIGAERMTITNRPEDHPRAGTTHLEARNITMRLQDTPFFFWPRYSTTLADMPLQSIAFGSRNEDAHGLQTRWNLFALLGEESPQGVQASAKADVFPARGAGTGLELDYNVGGSVGFVDLYGMYDTGDDKTSAGRDVDPDREWRGVALWEQHTRLNPDWSLQTQASFISDRTFISSWREDDFRDRREYETSAYLKGQRDNSAITLLAKYELNDFVSNDYLLASRAYQTEKLPELTYRRYGDSFGEVFTYSTENRISRVRLVMHDGTPRETGVPGDAFGINNDDEIDAALRAGGLPTHFVNRADSRHELSMPLQVGIFRVVPFVVGRITAYDDTFDALSDDPDDVRLFGAAGLSISTQFQRVDNTVHSRLFDLNRLRHIIEPSITAWYGYSSVDQHELPIFDEGVESVGDGSVVKVGVRNIFQTQRGGPGRWHSVDVLSLDTSLVLNSNDVDRQSPTPQFFDYRPEHSMFGDHVHAALQYLVSDSLSILGEATYDLDHHQLARGAIGFGLRHHPSMTTTIEYRVIEASRNELLDLTWAYQMTPKYAVNIRPQWDFRENQFRAIDARLTRSFPDFDLLFQMRFDRIRDEVTFGATLGLAQF